MGAGMRSNGAVTPAEMQARIGKLELALEHSQRLHEVKDEKIAALEAQVTQSAELVVILTGLVNRSSRNPNPAPLTVPSSDFAK